MSDPERDANPTEEVTQKSDSAEQLTTTAAEQLTTTATAVEVDRDIEPNGIQNGSVDDNSGEATGVKASSRFFTLAQIGVKVNDLATAAIAPDPERDANPTEDVTQKSDSAEQLTATATAVELKEDENSEEATGVKASSRFLTLAQIGVKVNDLATAAIASVKERFFGEDYWIPSDPYEVVEIKPELLACHQLVYPENAKIGRTPLIVVRGSPKNNESALPLNHVVYKCFVSGRRVFFTIFRSRALEEALNFCRRCDEYRVLFGLLDQKKDIRKSIWDVTYMIKLHPLWRMVHIAIACQRADIFTDNGLEYIRNFGYSVDDLTKIACSPEGKYPLMLAIEKEQEAIVRFLLRIGADPLVPDPRGNNCLHYAALSSVNMIEILLAIESCRALINSANNDGETPAYVAVVKLNFLCLNTLTRVGGELGTGKKSPILELMGKNFYFINDIIRAVLETSPNAIKDTDPATGNTCLHAAQYKSSLMGILHLKHRELDLNAKNKAGLTPLHQFVIRGDLSLVMCIASYGAKLDMEADGSKMTALHLAVSQRNLEITRLLLCLGADPNRKNTQGDTPRHLASKLNAIELLKSLIISGAQRCPSSKAGCGSGCVEEKLLQILKKPSSMPAIAETAKSPTSLVEDFENRTFIQKQQRYNKVLDPQHNAIFDEMIEKLTQLANDKTATKNYINLLALDGGGIRGLVITQIMIEIERMLGQPLFSYFDWVAGTSTGAIVSGGLATGQTLRQMQRVYLRFKDLVFETRRPHNTIVLETFIQEEMGKERLLNQIKWPRLIFTTTRADYFPVQLEMMRNYKLPASEKENAVLGFNNTDGLPLWKALRRSSAAPTYFSPVDNKYIDGGIISNNPTLELIQEIQFWNSFMELKKLPSLVRIGCVLSIGTGAIPPTKREPEHLELAQNYLIQPRISVNAVMTIGQILVDQVTATEGAPVARASSTCLSLRAPYFRLSAPLHKDIQMDAKDDLEIARMMWDCMEYTDKQRGVIEHLCQLLKAVGPACQRRELFREQGPQREREVNANIQSVQPRQAMSRSQMKVPEVHL